MPKPIRVAVGLLLVPLGLGLLECISIQAVFGGLPTWLVVVALFPGMALLKLVADILGHGTEARRRAEGTFTFYAILLLAPVALLAGVLTVFTIGRHSEYWDFLHYTWKQYLIDPRAWFAVDLGALLAARFGIVVNLQHPDAAAWFHPEQHDPRMFFPRSHPLNTDYRHLIWHCPCGEVNIRSHTRCRVCDAARKV
jgi:hypothetical protein